MLTIKAQKREKNQNNSDLRSNGVVPAVFYGPKESPVSVSVNENDFLKVYDEAGTSSIIVLNDGTEDHDALIHEIQFDAVTQKPIHVDFYVVEKGKKVEVEVPIEFIGVSPAEKQLGGILVKVLHELHIEAMPKDLPHNIEVNVESLVDFESQIHVKDIKLPNGVEMLTDLDEVVALIQEPKEEEEEEAPADLDSIEVEKKGKAEEEGGSEGDSEKSS